MPSPLTPSPLWAPAGAMALMLLGASAQAQAQLQSPQPQAFGDWQACAALTGDAQARLACFDRWAAQRAPADTTAAQQPPAVGTSTPAEPPQTAQASVPRCRDRHHSELSRFWELEPGTSCGTLRIRGYRPVSLSVIGSNSVATQPTSPNPLNNAPTAQPYQNTETRLQLSVRTKIATGLLPHADSVEDSLWFGYTQQSYWQLFNPGLSRPFRNTDHEPELVYVYPLTAPLAGGWQLRYGGLGLVHQSNGQTLPLSRSWNRVYLMGGMEHGPEFRITARVWHRLPESRANDDNPDISSRVGRAELGAAWQASADDSLAITLRHSLQRTARGSVRLEWLRQIGEADSGLRFHTQLFSGYGDSLVDYNRRRTVLSVGLSLVDF